jgi:cytochrome b
VSNSERGRGRQRVWDVPVRLLHWALVATILAAWLTREWRGPWHLAFGYGAAAIVALRVLWGFTGSRHARFADFLQGPQATLKYAGQVLRGQAPRYVGHNPAGAWMVVALLATLACVCLTGWLFTTDWLWGYAWLENLHAALAWLLAALVALHLAGVVFTSWHQRENLIRAMVDGRKDPRQ